MSRCKNTVTITKNGNAPRLVEGDPAIHLQDLSIKSVLKHTNVSLYLQRQQNISEVEFVLLKA
ncbi:hypothetical protein PHLCEN_2v7326 [Hermanssonia centrifuga]|uniref:Uncharacterized protein n=1 Tax=Hermanssonia centrifuga TaxID=98765 RepID=A0A2R6NWS0_9APHY|nr:hypothetical protein PHLCEN_2v7326 [Hermanssonia centrifuga]